MSIQLRLSVLLLAMVSVTQAQQVASTQPLGDFAREQRQAKTQEKKPAADKVYSEVGTAPAEVAADGKEKERILAQPAHRSVFDQARSTKPDFIIIPAGTEIRVDIVESKVIAPVRVGFATPIPPLSIAAVKVNQNFFAPISYNVSSTTSSNASVIYGESAELTSVTVRGVSYPLQANRIALNGGATFATAQSVSSSRDAVFVLTAPLAIER
jgi:hypothetical protein